MTKAFRFYETGGSDVLRFEDVEVGAPGTGEVRLRQEAIGLNYIDIYFRSGVYPAPSLPSGLGLEGSGVIEAVGDGVTDLAVGDRVAYAAQPLGAYAEARVMPAKGLVKIPDGISFDLAAAAMLQGMTAQYLLRRTYHVKKGDTILIHAAAGGVGQIVCQWAKHLGATVIGTVGSKEKAEIAKSKGCDYPILYREEKVSERVKEITNGQGVEVVYDSVGKDTFDDSLDCLKRLGMMVSFGQSSGAVPPVPLKALAPGAYFLTRPSVFQYTATREELLATANELFDVLKSGVVKIDIGATYDLADAKHAHDDLEGRKTTGSVILKP
ncbi:MULTISPECIES: quinone oxidoreductase family protein [Thalassospira]|jgi:NADPH2:quinone reductase|uniref:Quinone oxidoreductase n=1 Tax=Thalassospira xiamenensis TaxID=220697 RepID=A0ABR5Y1H2_9PROT|nr:MULTISPECIES: quinone oxidoreductase [Thalassospira]KZD01743.1 quinone oxidoreductase [Thalassospira xiamenensis]KZD11226.1 quinone oxidoreductase [Thalassospira xiamenensis]MAB32612.1 quinone oxidoreductase [Thalassospira sp.]MBA06458.1 quinone oxidoreductase [Thalassospira sp.]MBL4841700.1 quinone oxidoreductase [Thalassospira sp.]|tara:strand:- start:6077 stop:7051 length:975 start_codon:yes stop_codon:yes gene_type:complete